MTWLIACACSGILVEAMLARGIDAVQCDLKPSEREVPHIQGDVRPLLRKRWRGVISFPDCTYLANSGVRWLHSDASRWPKMFDAAEFFLECLNANAPKVAAENPVMHKYARRLIGRGPDFTVQPWQFGDDFKKRTCFWTKNLPKLSPTSTLDGSTAYAAVHRAAPSAERKADRARSHPGMMGAIAEQWALARDLVDMMEAA